MNITKLINLTVLCFTKILAALRNNPWGIPVPAMVGVALVVGAVVVVKFLPVVLLLGVAAFAVAAWSAKEDTGAGNGNDVSGAK